MNNINSINFLHPEELASMHKVRLEVTKISIGKDAVSRSMFSGLIKFAKDVEYGFSLNRDEYALLKLKKESKYAVDQFELEAKVRFIETKWPPKDGKPGNSTYLMQLCVDDDRALRWEFDIHKTKFLDVYKSYKDRHEIKAFEPVVRIPGAKEEAVEIQEVKETEDTPF